MAKAFRYQRYLDDKGVTPTEFSRLTVTEKLPYVEWWLNSHFDKYDPGYDDTSMVLSGGTPIGVGRLSGAPKPAGNPIDPKEAVALFPEWLTRSEIAEIAMVLTSEGRANTQWFERPSIPLPAIRHQSGIRKLKRVERNIETYNRPAGKTFGQLSVARKLAFMDTWLNRHFTKSEAVIARQGDEMDSTENLYRQPMQRDGEPFSPGGSGLNTPDLLRSYFPFRITDDELAEAVNQFGFTSWEGDLLRTMEARWHLRPEYSFENLKNARAKQTKARSEPAYRVYRDDDDTTGKTLNQLKRMSRDAVEPYLVHWFYQNYEDPVHSLPYIGSEGGYQWINGEPADAAEVLQGHFGDHVDYRIVNAIANRIEAKSGTVKWSRIDDGSGYEARDFGDETASRNEAFIRSIFNDDTLDSLIAYVQNSPSAFIPSNEELLAREELRTAASRLSGAIRLERRSNPLIGHNSGSLTDDLEHAQATLEISVQVERELSAPQPDVGRIAKLLAAAKLCGRWIFGKVDKYADNFAAEAGKNSARVFVGGATVYAATWVPELANLLQKAAPWLATLIK
ncbi:hypothetical protein [Teichococcus deserti]|uniref:hypothetical protein n=1 Tax=Teichococcus deserti TaxID=1817963 RepID=UPI0010557E1E|nr:hypothetical protein [Pseudoroseomonas deserti]